MAADQNRSIQALAAGPVSERSVARSVLTWGAPVWKATMFAVCHQPPSGFAETAWVEDTAVALPSDAVRAALMLLRSVAHAGCVVSQEPNDRGRGEHRADPVRAGGETGFVHAPRRWEVAGPEHHVVCRGFVLGGSWQPGQSDWSRNAAMPAAAPAAATKSTTMAMAEA